MLAVLFDWLIFEPLPSVSTSLNTPPAGRIELTVTAPYGSGPVIRPIMPHAIRRIAYTEISTGAGSFDVGTALDMSSAGMMTPSPPPEDIIQGSASFFE